MAEMQKKKKSPRTWDEIGEESIVDPAFPSDQELTDAKSNRKQTADNVTQYLAEKGWPMAGALAGTITDLSADMIPGSRKEYQEAMIPSMGTTSKVSKMAMPAKAAADAEAQQAARKIWNGMSQAEKEAQGVVKFDDFFVQHTAPAPELIPAAKAQPDINSFYKKTQANEPRRMMEDDRVIKTTQRTVDPNKAQPKASVVQAEKPVIQNAKFPEFDGISHQQQMKMGDLNKKIDELRRSGPPPAKKK